MRKQLSWVLGCEAGGSSLSLRWRGARRGGWLVPISSGAGLGLLRPLRGSLRSGNPTPTARANLAFPNDRGLAPAPPRHCARIVPVFVPTKPLARRRGVLGSRSRFPNGFTTTKPAPRGLCEISPNLVAELPLLGHWRAPSGRPRCGRLPSLSLGSPRRGAAALAFSRALLFPTMALPCSPWRRWRRALLFQTAASGISHPRARFACA